MSVTKMSRVKVSVRKRLAFTLVELLVVIAIIGMLVSLLLPAVNAARESGRRAVCQNNMRNVALALYSYDANKNSLPGFATSKLSLVDNNPYIRPILYEIFPNLERNDLYDRFSREKVQADLPTGTDANDVTLPFMAVLVCPSDPQNTGPATAFCYNYGYGSTSFWNKVNGVFGPLASAPLNYVSAKDGNANTVLISENIDARWWSDASPLRLGFSWTDIAQGSVTSWHINRLRGQSGDDPLQPGNPANANYSSNGFQYVRPSSNHPGVVNVGFCDTHVRTINENVAYVVWAQLMCPDGANATMDVNGTAPSNQLVRQYYLDEKDIN